MTVSERNLESPEDEILQEDLDRIADLNLPYEQLDGASVLVTGATGLVGSVLVRALACIGRRRGLKIRILPMIRSEEKARRIFGPLWDRAEICPVTGDMRDPVTLSGSVDYIIHGAGVTASKVMVTQPAETIDIALAGTRNMLELAKDKKVRSMVYLSSMEAFGRPDPSLPEVKEEDLGSIDLASVRSCYPETKRMCELMCTCHAKEYGTPVKSARLAQTFGAGVSKEEGRVFAQFAKSVIDGKDIVLHTKGESWGNYCYTADVAAGIFTILLKGENGETYTVANPKATARIRDMAQMAAEELAGGAIRVIYDIPEDALKYGYAPDVVMHLNSDKLQALGWRPQQDLPDMYRRLIASFRTQGYGIS